MVDSEKLEEIIDAITAKIALANIMNELDSLLECWGLQELIGNNSVSSDDFYDTYKDGTIVVIGASQVKEHDLLGIAKSLGLSKDRFEFCYITDFPIYERDENGQLIVKFNFKKMQHKPNYRLVIVGPMPHSTAGKGDSSSAIAEMETRDGYPKVVRLGSNELKITKTSFKKTLQKQIAADYI